MIKYYVVDSQGSDDFFEVTATDYTQACEAALARLGFIVKTETKHQKNRSRDMKTLANRVGEELDEALFHVGRAASMLDPETRGLRKEKFDVMRSLEVMVDLVNQLIRKSFDKEGAN